MAMDELQKEMIKRFFSNNPAALSPEEIKELSQEEMNMYKDSLTFDVLLKVVETEYEKDFKGRIQNAIDSNRKEEERDRDLEKPFKEIEKVLSNKIKEFRNDMTKTAANEANIKKLDDKIKLVNSI